MNPLATAWYQSPIGPVCVRGDQSSVSSVSFMETVTDSDGELPEMLGRCLRELDEYFSGTRREFTVTVRQNGTPFQQRVWTALGSIPFGRTVSYLHVAHLTGDPGNVRAVGAANGKNHVAVIVPCHRVIGSDGKLVGYAGELWRKQWLLEHEAKLSGGNVGLF